MGGIIQLRTVLQLHKQHCSICEDDIQAQQALLKQDKGDLQLNNRQRQMKTCVPFISHSYRYPYVSAAAACTNSMKPA